MTYKVTLRRVRVTIVVVEKEYVLHILSVCLYKGADKSLARPDWKNNWKIAIFWSDAEVVPAAEICSDGQHFELFLSGLHKLEFCRCILFPSSSG